MNERIDFKSDKAVIISKIFGKLKSKKTIFGKFVAKENASKMMQIFKLKKGEIYPNGRLKDYNNQKTFQLDFKIKYVDED